MPNLQLEIQGKGSLPSGEGAGKACGGCRHLRPMGRLQSPQHGRSLKGASSSASLLDKPPAPPAAARPAPRAQPRVGPHLLRQRAPWDRRPASSSQQLDLLQGRVVLPPPRTHQREGGTPVHNEAGSVRSGHWRTTPHPARSRHFWSLPPRYAIQEDHEHNGVVIGKTEDVSPCQRKVMESGGVVYMKDLPVYTQKRIVHHSALSVFICCSGPSCCGSGRGCDDIRKIGQNDPIKK
ncbi:uncharacterized protein LOC128310968 [Acinonyx jubatus]|uniref:Uncharacterized protein LOC128310968 n=1 Tax=Acinonyx jubatus TaxID=32536 RepID=A0ABM3NIT6_ACIJB|nr:uncharacterized protein LOC128310968 [Acinonyx jubatus]